MPPSLRERALLKKPNIKRPGSATTKPKFAKRSKPRFSLQKKRDLPRYEDDDDDDFIKSDAESASSVHLSSESEDEEVVIATKEKKGNTSPAIANIRDRLIDALEEIIRVKDFLIQQKDGIIATHVAEIERLQRMVRSLELH
jgi:hypothetical protein